MTEEALRFLEEVLKDVRTELEVPEVSELTTLALDRKVDTAIEMLENHLGA